MAKWGKGKAFWKVGGKHHSFYHDSLSLGFHWYKFWRSNLSFYKLETSPNLPPQSSSLLRSILIILYEMNQIKLILLLFVCTFLELSVFWNVLYMGYCPIKCHFKFSFLWEKTTTKDISRIVRKNHELPLDNSY